MTRQPLVPVLIRPNHVHTLPAEAYDRIPCLQDETSHQTPLAVHNVIQRLRGANGACATDGDVSLWSRDDQMGAERRGAVLRASLAVHGTEQRHQVDAESGYIVPRVPH